MDDTPLSPPTKRLRAELWIRWTFLAAGLLLPAASLIPIGSYWLWQNGYLLHWSLAAVAVIAAWHLVVLRVFRSLKRPDEFAPGAAEADPAWNEAERRAWADVIAVAAAADPAAIASREAAMKLAIDAVTAVAHRLHPEVQDPLWRFTVPDVLTIIERVSARLRALVDETVPFGDVLTVAQALAIYRWRGAVDVLDKAYGVWRIARLANPATAATHELRERLSRDVVEWGRQHFARVLVEAYVKEVGRAAIDLYGGRLRAPRPSAESAAQPAKQPGSEARRWPIPRVLRQAGKAGRLIVGSLRSQRKRLEK